MSVININPDYHVSTKVDTFRLPEGWEVWGTFPPEADDFSF